MQCTLAIALLPNPITSINPVNNVVGLLCCCYAIQSMRISDKECESAWQKKDYKLFPHKFTTLADSDPHSMPPIMVSC